MTLVKKNLVVTDEWAFPAEGDAVPAATPAALPLARYLAERDTFEGRNAPLGLVIAAGEDIAPVVADLDRFSLIVLTFPKYTDGRAYSTARLLRERHGYKGELRASGNVLRDQIRFMQRCGFDAFDVAHQGTLEALTSGAIVSVTHHYQPAGLEAREGRPAGARPWLRVSTG
jgi:uncharacterized protein (DUF934 family)